MIPYGRQHISDDDIEAVVAVLAGLFLIVAGVALAWPSRRSIDEAPTEEVTR